MFLIILISLLELRSKPWVRWSNCRISLFTASTETGKTTGESRVSSSALMYSSSLNSADDRIDGWRSIEDDAIRLVISSVRCASSSDSNTSRICSNSRLSSWSPSRRSMKSSSSSSKSAFVFWYGVNGCLEGEKIVWMLSLSSDFIFFVEWNEHYCSDTIWSRRSGIEEDLEPISIKDFHCDLSSRR